MIAQKPLSTGNTWIVAVRVVSAMGERAVPSVDLRT